VKQYAIYGPQPPQRGMYNLVAVPVAEKKDGMILLAVSHPVPHSTRKLSNGQPAAIFKVGDHKWTATIEEESDD